MNKRLAKIIVTLGPATRTEEALIRLKDKGVDFVRTNMSHSTLDDLAYFIRLAKKVGVPFIIDTEGSQVRTGVLTGKVIELAENDEVLIRAHEIEGTRNEFSLKPGSIIEQLQAGDLIHIDFDTLILRVADVSTAAQGFVSARAVTGGIMGTNKAVVIDPVLNRPLQLPALSPKDLESIKLGLAEGIGHIAVSFVRSAETVAQVRELTQGRMEIISKIECMDGLQNLDAIIAASDAILIDRGDLSKEIPVEKIPYAQKIILQKAKRLGTPTYVATNLLETMIEKRKPTRAEVHDVMGTVTDGANGLTMAAETAIGKYPLECVNVLRKLIRHAEMMLAANPDVLTAENQFITKLEQSNYLLDVTAPSSLITPHGGKLVQRVLANPPDETSLAALPRLRLTANQQQDVEQIAFGTYSPIEGFLGQADLECVLNDMRLASGVVWPLPILLDVDQDTAAAFSPGDTIALTDEQDTVLALLELQEKYGFDPESMARRMYGTTCEQHPGVQMVQNLHPVLLAGPVSLVQRRMSETSAYELTPRQVRRLFEERDWAKVVGFHTRNVIHRGHEFMQMLAMQEELCDGLFVHPVVGRKKPGDFKPQYIIKSYEKMIESFYPRDKVVFATFSTFSRYAGPREALFTALCRKNFGCSHFIVGRDHTGVGDYYDAYASHRIFDQFPDLGIIPIRFHEVYYSAKLERYVHAIEGENAQATADDKLQISGTQARQMFEQGKIPPAWFMRPEIAKIILEAVKNGEEVFV
jgi:pyruvate kinase